MKLYKLEEQIDSTPNIGTQKLITHINYFVHKYKHMLFLLIYLKVNKHLYGGLERGIKVSYEN